MPKLPILSGSDVVKALERLGFVQMRQRDSHVVMRRGAVGTVVPLHKELKTGTLDCNCTGAGVGEDGWYLKPWSVNVHVALM